LRSSHVTILPAAGSAPIPDRYFKILFSAVREDSAVVRLSGNSVKKNT
jgi:hypothetical protein